MRPGPADSRPTPGSWPPPARRKWPPGDHGRTIEALTPREMQVLELLAEGLPNKAIAARLGISDQTVKFHVASIAGKLGANRGRDVRRAVRRGLIATLVSRIRDSSHNSRAGHPGWRRCSSLTYAQYARSSRLASRAPRSAT